MRWWPALLVVAVVAGCGAEEQRSVPATTPVLVHSEEHGFTAEIPAGWDLASESLTPQLSNPVEILSAGTVRDPRPREGSCAHMPVGALERIGPRDAFVTVQERYGEPRFPDRPARFALTGRVDHGDAATCAPNEERLDEYWFGFRDANRGFHVLVVLGSDAPPERRAEALALLDSLRFELGPEGIRLDPDTAMASEDRAAGLSWQMPVPPWRRYDWPLTSAHGERLVLGTFDLERSPSDENCTPQAAIEAMPADGAFIYLFEYIDLADRWKRRIPEREGELSLGPEIAYECMGTSRMATWQEQGRAFQAHVYLGPRASDALERDVRSILNSIRVR
jgi:hypothetical protein